MTPLLLLFSALRPRLTRRLCGESFFTLGFVPCVSSFESARPFRPATAANLRATTGSTPGPQATSRPSGISDNNSSRSTHTGSSESSFRTACRAIHTARAQTSPPGTPSPFPEISRPPLRAALSSTNSASLASPETTDQSLPPASAASAAQAKAAPEKVSRPNTHSQFR